VGKEDGEVEERRVASGSLLFKGPTVVAALVCLVAALFAGAVGAMILVTPDALQGSILINLSGGGKLPSADLLLIGGTMVVLGVLYVISAALLWSEVQWIRGVYVGIVVSMVGTVVSGLGTTLAPGIAAAGMIINVLIVTLLATETWEARRAMKGQ
jgi:hypothetical protein